MRDPYDPTSEVIVTRAGTGLPAGCQLTDVAGLITNFTDAFNAGDSARLPAFFASDGDQPPAFQWYAVTGAPKHGARPHFVARERNQLLHYLDGRHRRGERLKPLVFDVGRSSSLPRSVGVVFALLRHADDLAGSGEMMLGKGEVDCQSQTIYVWAMGAVVGHRRTTLPGEICPLPGDWSVRNPGVVACGRVA
ncbi:MAG: hypothetical protein ACREON_01245 [Gemmatimonadaceae bacterium]